MISCTDFIPCYSELFKFLEEQNGSKEVDTLWEYLFKPSEDGHPLIKFVKEEGIHGCWTHWTGTLNEEAADFTLYLNEKRGFFMIEMHKCPSKGRLLQYKEERGLIPYYNYCLHCDHYRAAIESAGLNLTYNFLNTDRAACTLLVTDPKVFDGTIVLDEDTEIMVRKASDNEYYHPGFHRSMNRCIEYVGLNHGTDAVKKYLQQCVTNVFHSTVEKIKMEGLSAIESHIRETYKKEKSEDVLSIQKTASSLQVAVAYCPAENYIKHLGYKICPWFRYTTETVMEAFADAAGLTFTMELYDEETGAAKYRFDK